MSHVKSKSLINCLAVVLVLVNIGCSSFKTNSDYGDFKDNEVIRLRYENADLNRKLKDASAEVKCVQLGEGLGRSTSTTIKKVSKKLMDIAINDPDAFDLQNLKDTGLFEYMCPNDYSYSLELDSVCAEAKRVGLDVKANKKFESSGCCWNDGKKESKGC